MFTGTVLAWNAELGRGLIESRMTGEIHKFTSACIMHPQDLLNMREGLQVFFTTFQTYAPKVEIISSSFDRLIEELETDPNANRRVLA